MDRFCTKCGSPLENGRCPYCDAAPETDTIPLEPEDTEPFWGDDAWNVGNDVKPRPGGIGTVFYAVQDMFRYREIWKILPTIGILILAVVQILWTYEERNYVAYGVVLFRTWLAIFGCLGAAAPILGLWKKRKKSELSLLLMGVCVLFALAAVNTFFNVLRIAGLNLYWPKIAALLALLGFWQTKRDAFGGRIAFWGACAAAAGVVLTDIWYPDAVPLLADLCTIFSYIVLIGSIATTEELYRE